MNVKTATDQDAAASAGAGARARRDNRRPERRPPGSGPIGARMSATLVGALALAGCADAVGGQPARHRAPERIVGLPCEGCDAVFDGLPPAPPWRARIAPASEPGEAMQIDGVVRNRAQEPVAGVIVYGYQTNNRGIYPRDEGRRGRAGFRHGTLRGWARTDARGRYRFDTIRPAGYPETSTPAHVHLHVIEVGRCTYYIDEIVFEDDPRLTKSARQRSGSGRGGRGITKPTRDAKGTWLVTRDIVLGANIPGYGDCKSTPGDR